MTHPARDAPWPSGFRTRRVLVRPLQADDVGPVTALHLDPAVMRHVDDALGPDSAADIARRLLRAAQRKPPSVYAWMLQTLDSGALVGLMTVTPSPEPARGELGLMFDPKLSGCGYATEVVAELLQRIQASGGMLDARHRPGNVPVRQLMRRLGFQPQAGEGGYVRWRSGLAGPWPVLSLGSKG
ncbi:GNAT family N-acetyltransferase [Luteimonas yindakuii]|uniref:GNAT family N-acetyltransferase n=1 Tax=Luteimonas yindakuii TaxID=2565782 RepID=UPI0014247D28|nr:GNAT family N-acetyltransferase [Luteimonas yindakuii]